MIVEKRQHWNKDSVAGSTQIIDFQEVQFSDAIFDTVRDDYPDFDDWVNRCRAGPSSRPAIVANGPGLGYHAVAILKLGECTGGPADFGMKISTFKVAAESEGHGLANEMMEAVFRLALEEKIEQIFITVPKNHGDLVRFLERSGFRRAPRNSANGDSVYVAELTNFDRMYPHLNRLAYDALAQEYESRSLNPGPNQEDPASLAQMLTKHIQGNCDRILELGPGSGSVLAELQKVSAHSIGVEISPEMAKIAARRSPNSSIVIANALEIEFPPRHFDGIFAGAFIHLFPKNEAKRLLVRMASWTRPGGAILVNTSVSKLGAEAIEDKLDYLHRVARFRSRWTEHEFESMLGECGLTILGREETNETERGKKWVAFICSSGNEGETFA